VLRLATIDWLVIEQRNSSMKVYTVVTSLVVTDAPRYLRQHGPESPKSKHAN
jgi:hypothetical protein